MPVTARIVRVAVSDRDGGRAETSFRLSSLDSLTNALTAAVGTLVPAIHGVSDGIASQVVAYLRGNDSAPGAGGNSLISRRVIIFWRNTDDNIASLILPALAEGIDSVSGYLDARILTLNAFDALTLDLQSLGAQDATGIPINGTVIAAALIV